jgi:branched-chain amino acid transport system ATP-binding protein
VIDKYVQKLVQLADQHTLIERGKVVWQGGSGALESDRALWQRYIGV